MKRRSNQPPRRYERHGYLALEPRAFLDWFVVPEARDNEVLDGGVAVVDIIGPLDQYDDGWCDSYEAVRQRVKTACADSATRTVVLRIDSPGGDCAGCFDTARALRRLCDEAKKPLLAFVEGKACSAGYALASSAQSIVLSDTAIVGSIGVISTRDDLSAMNASRGIRVALIASGKHKADGHPDQPISEAELKEAQIIVDSLARKFFELVSEMRGLSVDEVAALDARIFHGDAAIGARLADTVESFDSLVERIARGDIGGTDTMATAYEKAKNALQEAAKGDDANAEAAKKALIAMGIGAADGDDDDKPPVDDGAEGDDDKPDAEGDDDKPDAEGDDDKPATEGDDDKPKSATQIALQALAEVHKLKAKDAKRELAAERKQLLDTRPDFAPELRAALEQADMKTVRNMVKTLPRVTQPKVTNTQTKIATRGKTQISRTNVTPPPAQQSEAQARASELDRRMGITSTKLGVKRSGTRVSFGVIDVDDAENEGATQH